MKATRILLPMLAVPLMLASGCKKDDNKTEETYTCQACVKTAEALAANDASSKGIYKGIIIGSSGTIKFNLMNGGTAISAVMTIDGTTVNLTATVGWQNGVAYVAPFTGTMNGQPVSITFSVQPDGTDPTIEAFNIPGHPNATFGVVKETSGGLIECFEGTYSSPRPETGTFNLFVSRDLKRWGGVHRGANQGTTEEIEGTINSAGDLLELSSGTKIGSLVGDAITGSFKDDDGYSVTLNGKRTL